MRIDKLTAEDVEESVIKYGQKVTTELVKYIQSHNNFYEGLNSEIGVAILNDLVAPLDALLSKIIDLTATDKEKIEYKIRREILDRWTKKLQDYEEKILKLKGVK